MSAAALRESQSTDHASLAERRRETRDGRIEEEKGKEWKKGRERNKEDRKTPRNP